MSAAGTCLVGHASEDGPTGTLVLNVDNYESEVKLKKNIRKQFDHSGLDWGINEDDLVITLVNRSYIGVDLSYLTRYGESKSLELPAGDYSITCIGIALESLSRDVEQLLSKSAFFNKDVLGFSIRPGETTQVDVHPLIRKQKAGFLVKAFTPQLRVVVQENGQPTEDKVISDRIASSIPWDHYSGPLKD